MSCPCPSFAPRLNPVCASVAPRHSLLTVCCSAVYVLTTPCFHPLFRLFSCLFGFASTPTAFPAISTLYVGNVSLPRNRQLIEQRSQESSISLSFAPNHSFARSLLVALITFPNLCSALSTTEAHPLPDKSSLTSATQLTLEDKNKRGESVQIQTHHAGATAVVPERISMQPRL